MDDDQRWMRRCLELAERARRRGDAPVGAVVVRAGRVLAEAEETVPSTPDPVGHAELRALIEAFLARGCGARPSAARTQMSDGFARARSRAPGAPA